VEMNAESNKPATAQENLKAFNLISNLLSIVRLTSISAESIEA
jgi:hypothetical protein